MKEIEKKLKIEVVNLTPHAITFIRDGKSELVIEPSGSVARVSAQTVVTGYIYGNLDLPITTTEFGEVVGLPEPKEGTIYIVSSLVAGRVKTREDVFIPNESVRDDQGRIVGCKSLGRI